MHGQGKNQTKNKVTIIVYIDRKHHTSYITNCCGWPFDRVHNVQTDLGGLKSKHFARVELWYAITWVITPESQLWSVLQKMHVQTRLANE